MTCPTCAKLMLLHAEVIGERGTWQQYRCPQCGRCHETWTANPDAPPAGDGEPCGCL